MGIRSRQIASRMVVESEGPHTREFRVEELANGVVDGIILLEGPFVGLSPDLHYDEVKDILFGPPVSPEDSYGPGAFCEIAINDRVFLQTPLYALPLDLPINLKKFLRGQKNNIYSLSRKMCLEDNVRISLHLQEGRSVKGVTLGCFLKFIEIEMVEDTDMAKLMCGNCSKELIHKNEDYSDYEISEGKVVKLCSSCGTEHFKAHQDAQNDIGDAIQVLLEEDQASGDIVSDVQQAVVNGEHAVKILNELIEYCDDELKSLESGAELDAEDVLNKVHEFASQAPPVVGDEEEEEEAEE